MYYTKFTPFVVFAEASLPQYLVGGEGWRWTIVCKVSLWCLEFGMQLWKVESDIETEQNGQRGEEGHDRTLSDHGLRLLPIVI